MRDVGEDEGKDGRWRERDDRQKRSVMMWKKERRMMANEKIGSDPSSNGLSLIF